MNLDKEFIPYEQALALKELGFDEPCFGLFAPPCKTVFLHHYGLLTAKEQILAPTFSQAFRWFREKYDLVAEFNWHSPAKCYATAIYPNDFYLQTKSYEEAELACLIKLIEIVKQ